MNLIEQLAKDKWNKLADQYNQWDSLDSEEKSEYINSINIPANKLDNPYIYPVTCVVCNKTIEPLEFNDADIKKDYDMIDGGIVGKLYAPYGSKHDGNIYQIGICDDCIDNVKLKLIGNYLGYSIEELEKANEKS